MELKYNPERVYAALKFDKNNRVFCSEELTIQVPTRFMDVDLGSIGYETKVYANFPMILNSGEYATINLCCYVELTPSKTTKVTIDEVDYFEFFFEANTQVIKSDLVSREDGIIFRILNELVFKGKVPWYMSYEDHAALLDTADTHADAKVNNVPELMEMMTMVMARPNENKKIKLRHHAKSNKDFRRENTTFVPLMSVLLSVSNTFDKLLGSYAGDGIVGGLVDSSKHTSRVEQWVRTK